MLDIKITNAKTRNTGKELVEIGIENGKITAIASAVEGEAKQVITDGMVAVNGETCTMRGKKIRPGDTVTFAGHTLKVQSAQ